MTTPPRGIITALVTPFEENGTFDELGFRENIRYQMMNGVHGVVALATTGEFASLSLNERMKVADVVVDEVNRKIPVFIGVGSTDSRETFAMCEHARKVGADGIFVITPYFYRFAKQETVDYLKTIADKTPLQMMIYNSTYTGCPLDPEALMDLAKCSNITAYKEGNQLQLSEVVKRVGDRMGVFTARDVYTYETLAVGGAGSISFSANIVPRAMVELYEAAQSGDNERAREIQFAINPLVLQLVSRSFPAGIKTGMNILGLPAGDVRFPLTLFKGEERKALEVTLKAVKNLC